MVLEQAPAADATAGLADGVITPAPRAVHVVCVAAKSGGALARNAAKLADHLAANPTDDLGRVAHQLHLGREPFAQRATIVASSASQAAERLRSLAESLPAGGSPGAKLPALFIFPGQGSQSPRMGEGLYRGEPLFRAHVDR
eukprot:4163583-Prymnesium_polylepis.1